MFRVRPALVLVTALALAATACGSNENKELDLAKAEREIRTLTERVYAAEADVGAVKCPNRVRQVKGSAFTCTIAVDGEPLLIAVTQKDDEGNVRIQQAQAIVFTRKVETFIASYASRNGNPVSSVECGSKSVAARSPGERFSCTVQFEDGTSGVARLLVKNLDGVLSLSSLKPSQ